MSKAIKVVPVSEPTLTPPAVEPIADSAPAPVAEPTPMTADQWAALFRCTVLDTVWAKGSPKGSARERARFLAKRAEAWESLDELCDQWLNECRNVNFSLTDNNGEKHTFNAVVIRNLKATGNYSLSAAGKKQR